MVSVQAVPRERGILFTAEMVRAILDNRKRETRRFSCRYEVGDLLYVKETWAAFRQTSYEYDEWEQIVSPLNGSWADEYESHGPMVVEYRADFERSHDTWVRKSQGVVTHIIERWQSPLHMPKRHARIWLEVTAIRKERLQDITPESAIAEGLACLTKDGGRTYKYGIPDRDGWPGTDDYGWPWHDWHVDPRVAFARLWDRVNGEGAWVSNPEVYAITFRRVK